MVEPKDSGKIIGEINCMPHILHCKKNKWMENYIKICNKTVAQNTYFVISVIHREKYYAVFDKE